MLPAARWVFGAWLLSVVRPASAVVEALLVMHKACTCS